MFGTVVTFAIAVLFRTPESQLQLAREHIENAPAV